MTRKPFDYEAAYDWSASRCAGREHCRSELLRKLIEKGLPKPDCVRLLRQLETEGYLDEERYAGAFVHDKTLLDRWGRIKTRQALAMKGLPAACIDHALAGIDEAAYRETLIALLQEKARTVTAASHQVLKQKLVRYAAGRGFEPDLIFRVIDTLSEHNP